MFFHKLALTIFYFSALGLALQTKTHPTPATITHMAGVLRHEPVLPAEDPSTTITAGPIVITASAAPYNNPYTDPSAGGILFASIEAQVINAQEYQLRKTRQTSIIDPTGFRALLYSAAGFTGLALVWLIATRFKKVRLFMGSHEDRESEEVREDWQKQEQDTLSGKRSVQIEGGLPLYYGHPSHAGMTHRQVPLECTCDPADHARTSAYWEHRVSQTYPYPYPYPYAMPPPYPMYRQYPY